jgi:hypothetical protein
MTDGTAAYETGEIDYEYEFFEKTAHSSGHQEGIPRQ